MPQQLEYGWHEIAVFQPFDGARMKLISHHKLLPVRFVACMQLILMDFLPAFHVEIIPAGARDLWTTGYRSRYASAHAKLIAHKIWADKAYVDSD